MGNDGGSIPGRAELVKPKKKEIRVESELVAKVYKYLYFSLEPNFAHWVRKDYENQLQHAEWDIYTIMIHYWKHFWRKEFLKS